MKVWIINQIHLHPQSKHPTKTHKLKQNLENLFPIDPVNRSIGQLVHYGGFLQKENSYI